MKNKNCTIVFFAVMAALCLTACSQPRTELIVTGRPATDALQTQIHTATDPQPDDAAAQESAPGDTAAAGYPQQRTVPANELETVPSAADGSDRIDETPLETVARLDVPVDVRMVTTSETLQSPDGTEVLRLRTAVPRVELVDTTLPVELINAHFVQMAADYAAQVKSDLYVQALAQLEPAVVPAAEIPAEPLVYLAELSSNVTWNDNGYLCVVCTIYEYTGGEYGVYTEESFLFDLNTGLELSLWDLFATEPAAMQTLITRDIQTAANQAAADGLILYHKDYEKRIASEFSAARFFIQSGQLIVYYQSGVLADVSAGVQEFTLTDSLLKRNLASDFLFTTQTR